VESLNRVRSYGFGRVRRLHINPSVLISYNVLFNKGKFYALIKPPSLEKREGALIILIEIIIFKIDVLEGRYWILVLGIW